MNAQDILDHVRGDLALAEIENTASRPKGLTASSLGVCRAKAGFILSGEEPTDETDNWGAMRGTLLHDALGRLRLRYNPDIRQEQRGTVTIAGLEVSGAYDELLDGAVVDFKTRKKAECWARQRHGAKPEERMQAAVLARASGAVQAFMVYIPIDGSYDDWACVEIDVDQGFAEAEAWLMSVVNETQEHLPRDKGEHFCQSFCEFRTICRGAFVDLDPLVNADGSDRIRVYLDAKNAYKEAERYFEAAKADLEDVDGRNETHKIHRTVVAPTPSRAGHTRLTVREAS